VERAKVSVIMAVYNDGKNLSRTIQSVLQQEFGDFEYIIIDDASTDNTSEIVKKYRLMDERIRLVENSENMGLTKSLIKGIEKSRGRYIARIDSGDTMRIDRLRLQVQYLDSNPDVGLVASNCRVYVHRNGETINQYNSNISQSYDNLKKQLPYRNPISHVSVTFRRDVYEAVGGYDKAMTTSQDYDLWVRFLRDSQAFVFEEPLTTIIYEITNSISFQRNKAQIRNGIRIRLKYLRTGLLPLCPTIVGLLKSVIMYVLPSHLNSFLRTLYRVFSKEKSL
jgi:glycosyltransferase involved in cell wall biosynthesis